MRSGLSVLKYADGGQAGVDPGAGGAAAMDSVGSTDPGGITDVGAAMGMQPGAVKDNQTSPGFFDSGGALGQIGDWLEHNALAIGGGLVGTVIGGPIGGFAGTLLGTALNSAVSGNPPSASSMVNSAVGLGLSPLGLPGMAISGLNSLSGAFNGPSIGGLVAGLPATGGAPAGYATQAGPATNPASVGPSTIGGQSFAGANPSGLGGLGIDPGLAAVAAQTPDTTQPQPQANQGAGYNVPTQSYIGYQGNPLLYGQSAPTSFYQPGTVHMADGGNITGADSKVVNTYDRGGQVIPGLAPVGQQTPARMPNPGMRHPHVARVMAPVPSSPGGLSPLGMPAMADGGLSSERYAKPVALDRQGRDDYPVLTRINPRTGLPDYDSTVVDHPDQANGAGLLNDFRRAQLMREYYLLDPRQTPVEGHADGGGVASSEGQTPNDQGGLHAIAMMLERAGRNGDTILAHINPEEARLLKAMGGAGTINPSTGLPEYDWSDDLGSWISGLFGSGAESVPVMSNSAALAPIDYSTAAPMATSVDANITGGAGPGGFDSTGSYSPPSVSEGSFAGPSLGMDPLSLATIVPQGQGAMLSSGSSMPLHADGAIPGMDPTTTSIPSRGILSSIGSGLSGGIGDLIGNPRNALLTTGAGLAILNALMKPKQPSPTQSGQNQAAAEIAYQQAMKAAHPEQAAFNVPALQRNQTQQGKPLSYYLTAGNRPGVAYYDNQTGVSGPSMFTGAGYADGGMPDPSDQMNQMSDIGNPMAYADGGNIVHRPLVPAGGWQAMQEAAKRAQEDENWNRFMQFQAQQNALEGKQPTPWPGYAPGGMIGTSWPAQQPPNQYDVGMYAGGGGLDVPMHPSGQPALHVSGQTSRHVSGPGGGRDDKVPAWLDRGEFVVDAETNALLGDGSPERGSERMEKIREAIRKAKGPALSKGKISPNAPKPEKLAKIAMGGKAK